MRTKVPPTDDVATREFATRLLDELNEELKKRTPDQNGRNNLLLTSPDGSIWAVTVDDAGALSAAKVYG